MERFQPPEGPRPVYQGIEVHSRRRHHYGLFLVVVVVVLVAAGAVYVERHKIRTEAEKLLKIGGTTTTVATTTTTVAPVAVAPPAVAASLAPWQLPTPITKALVLPGPPGKLLVIGGQVASGGSGTGAFLVDTSTGHLSLYANLVSGVHDGAAADIGGQVYIFGGAGAGSTVQSFAAPGAGAKAAVSASSAGALPEARAGSAGVSIGASAYIVGGYRGATTVDQQVLSTSDGATYALVAKLPVPVRDAAVTATGGQIYVFGGEALTPATPGKAATPAKPATPTAKAGSASKPGSVSKPGIPSKPGSVSKPGSAATSGRAGTPPHWAPVSDIQHVDPATGQASVVGHLPVALTGAAAVNLDGAVYVTGGHGPAGFNATIWGFEPAGARLVVAGHLPHAVSGAGYAVARGVAWLVGGDSATGQPTGWVQSFRLTRLPGRPPPRKP